MPEWSQCRKMAYTTETRRLQGMLARHVESCRGDRDCPLNALETVMARQIAMQLQDRPRIVQWPNAKP
jgi:hypothetical protein